MKYSIAFKNLPFEPERRQVIYVENQYDERINAIIRDNYDWLKWTFKRANLDFVYLPMFFNDEEIKEKVLYYAPYLTEEIMEKAELRSSHLLGYMSHLENREKIAPSFLFAPRKDSGEWVFQGMTIDINTDENIEIRHWLEDAISDIEDGIISLQPRCSIRFQKVEDITLSADDEEIDSKPSKVEYSSTPSLTDKFKEWLHKYGRKCVAEEDDSYETSQGPALSSLDEILDEDVRETFRTMEKNIQRLRLLGVPLEVIIKFVINREKVSRLLVTDDLRLFLPDYNNIEITMPPMYKAVYLLFIYHREEGIVLQGLENYHNELETFYKRTRNVEQLTPSQLTSINRLESSWNGDGSIYTVLSRIKTAFKNVIDEHLARHYFIEGRPGEPYKLVLEPDLIIWEDEDE